VSPCSRKGTNATTYPSTIHVWVGESEQYHESMGSEGGGTRALSVVEEREQGTIALAMVERRRQDCS
jgi:hypothetical protein